jgi:hypothetical protein
MKSPGRLLTQINIRNAPEEMLCLYPYSRFLYSGTIIFRVGELIVFRDLF